MLNYHRQQPLHLLRVKERRGAMKCGDSCDLAIQRLSAYPRIQDHLLSRPMHGGWLVLYDMKVCSPSFHLFRESLEAMARKRVDLHPTSYSLASNLLLRRLLHAASHLSITYSCSYSKDTQRLCKVLFYFLSFMNVCLSVCLYACMPATARA